MALFKFDSTGGCALCDDMPEIHEEYPVRPHPFCDCDINPVSAAQYQECYVGIITAFVKADIEIKSKEVIFKFDLNYDIEVECLNSDKSGVSFLEFSETITMDKEHYKDEATTNLEIAESWMDEAYSELRTLGQEACQCDKVVPSDMPVG